MKELIYHAGNLGQPPTFGDHRGAIQWAVTIGAWPSYDEARPAYSALYEAFQRIVAEIWPRWISATMERLGGPRMLIQPPRERFERKPAKAKGKPRPRRSKRPLFAGSEQR